MLLVWHYFFICPDKLDDVPGHFKHPLRRALKRLTECAKKIPRGNEQMSNLPTSDDFNDILFEVKDNVAWITINRPAAISAL